MTSSNTKTIFIIQGRAVPQAEGQKPSEWINSPTLPGMDPTNFNVMLTELESLRAFSRGELENPGDPPSLSSDRASLGELYSAFGLRMETRLVKRVYSYTEEVVDEAELNKVKGFS